MSAPGYKRLEAEYGDMPREETSSKPVQPLSYQEPPPTYSAPTANTAVRVVTVAPTVRGVSDEPLNDHMVFSILTTICCFMPFGIVALFKSLEVRSAIQRGDYTTALLASKASRKFNQLSLILGIVIFVVVFVFTLAAQLSWIIPTVS